MRGLFILMVVIAICFFGYKYLNNEGTGSAPVQSATTVSPPAPEATGANSAPDMTAIEARLKAAAQKVGVEVTKFEPKGTRDAVVTVEWSGDVASLGGDFLTEAVIEQKIARDFDKVPVVQPMWTDAQGRRHYRDAYDLKF